MPGVFGEGVWERVGRCCAVFDSEDRLFIVMELVPAPPECMTIKSRETAHLHPLLPTPPATICRCSAPQGRADPERAWGGDGASSLAPPEGGLGKRLGWGDGGRAVEGCVCR